MIFRRIGLIAQLSVLCLATVSFAQADKQDAKPKTTPPEAANTDSGDEGSADRQEGEPSADRAERRPRGSGQRGSGQRGSGRGAGRPGFGTRGGGQRGQSGQRRSPDTPASTDDQAAEEKEEKKKATPALSQKLADQFKWRSIGPANMSGRITAIAVSEKDHSTWWAATASGGLLKTTNNGNTFEHQFDQESTVSIGDVQVSASNPDIVWVGTGESNPRNSVSWGDGVYKSVDGGKSWKNMGLKKTFQTGALAIHPENPDVVWVGSLGRLWGPNPERGLFKTTDGGKTWKKVLFVDDMTGVIDVQLNPKNPDEMLVATYERKRDGFDGNDPVQRFGAGAGIYKSVDGGESFERISKGLPSCKMGRIGLDYFEKDPSVVVAIVESEKIAKEPEDYSFAGLRGEDADVGARMVTISKDGPAEKAGLKVSDIVVSVDGRVIPSYREMMREIHKHPAGETVKLVVSRNRKMVDIDLELGKKPVPKTSSTSSRTSSRRTDFTGTLGGQAANLQDTQGPDGHEYGGIYLSEDGGSSWKRINSLNPRPMYYSNIQIDPVDRNNIYVCGTSLYKSKDGGETFTGDGGSDGIHVDHHALWINNKDPRHMILGNDGGIHMTHDRMEHWDHYNHVAIGQFYHASVDSNLDYNVYGGLQDNGSWGGPSRSKSGSGPINSDWFNVGGGDGFVTLADPNDPNQIYYESQNGGMGRTHLETGERGFIRPRERGKRFRFNWKTPFILSPHNSKIHLSAGNHVFRSYDRGNDAKRISPDITNTEKGAGSAITESPLEAGVIYVGTTDGAVWMTKDGGKQWVPLFFTPEAKTEKETESSDGDGKSEGDKDVPAGEPDADPVSGRWMGRLVSDRIPEDRAEFNFTLKLDGNKVSGEVDGRQGPEDIIEGTFKVETGAISFVVENERGEREYSGTIKNGKLTGIMSVGDGRFELPVEATKKKDPSDDQSSNSGLLFATNSSTGLALALVSPGQFGRKTDDPVTGSWECAVEGEEVPNGRVEFTMELVMDKKGQVSGQVVSPMGDSEITEGVFNAESNRILITAEGEQAVLQFKGTIDGSDISGSLEVNDGALEVEFDGKKVGEDKPAVKTSAEAAESQPAKKSQEAASGESKQEPQPQDADAEKGESQEATAKDDGISGTWKGEMVSPRGEQDVTIVIKRKTDSEITGTFVSSQGEREINRGSYDPESKQLTLATESERFSLEFTGAVEGKTYAGELSVNQGSFTMEFSLERTSRKQETGAESEEDATPEERPKGLTGEKTLSGQMPGPRWVSSLEASRFKKERCYITLDGHRSNDDGVYVFVTNDYGQTWESLTTNLPATAGSARVIREDLVNENLLFLGCEFSSWYSIDQGETWTRIKGGLPTVSVHEFAIHPSAGEVVAATHGRSLWIADISVLRQLSSETLAEDAHLYKSKDAIRWRRRPSRGSSGTRKFVGTNPASGTVVAYSLGKNARRVELEIVNLEGDTVKSFDPPTGKGLHLLNWDLRGDSSGRSRAPAISTGDYLVRLKVDGQLHQTRVSVKSDPTISAAAAAELEKQLQTPNIAFGDDD